MFNLHTCVIETGLWVLFPVENVGSFKSSWMQFDFKFYIREKIIASCQYLSIDSELGNDNG